MITIEQIKIDHLDSPFGFYETNPIIYWIISGCKKQNAYQIIATINHDTYDSGIIFDDKMRFQFPFSFKSRDSVKGILAVWDENQQRSENKTFSFELAIANNDFIAKWINPEIDHTPKINHIDYSSSEVKMHHQMHALSQENSYKERPSSYLKKLFNLKQIRHSRLYITAHGTYQAFINGQLLNTFFMSPGVSQYDQLMPYQAYDVTAYLKEGENEILIVIGNGWWRGQVLNSGMINAFGDDVALLCQLENNHEVVLISDESWIASQSGPLRDTDTMNGEIYDATKEIITTWHGVKIEPFGTSNLYASNCQNIKEHEAFNGQIIYKNKNSYVIDFGQNIAGIISFDLIAEHGQTIHITHGETLDEKREFTIANIQNIKGIKQEVLYTCKKGRNQYKTSHAYFGFRYIKVETEISLTGHEFIAHAVYTDMKQTGYFESGNPKVNQLFHNALWSMKSNFVDVPTDCPHREKAGYSGDLQTFTHTALYLMDSYPIIRKFLMNQASSQYKDGCIRQVVPDMQHRYPWDGGVGWADSIVLVPYRMYLRDNQIDLLAKLYPTMKKWVTYQLNRASITKEENEDNPFKTYLLDTGMHWGEWMEPGFNAREILMQIGQHGEPEVGTAYLFESSRIMLEVARLLHYDEDIEFYQNVVEKTKKAYQYYYKKHKLMDSTRMCHFVRPLAFNLFDVEDSIIAAQQLNNLVIKNNYHLNTGFLTTHQLCQTLTDYGYIDTAYELLLQESIPSWLYEVNLGSTTIWEQWDAIDENGIPRGSLNHYSAGSIVGWLFDSVAGIRLNKGKLIIKPHPTVHLGYVNCQYDSPYGEIISNWKIKDQTITYQFSIPPGIVATIILQSQILYEISSGEYTFVEKLNLKGKVFENLT